MTIESIIKEAKPSLVLITTHNTSNSQLRIVGSGFVVTKDGHIISAAHVSDSIPEEERQFLSAFILKPNSGKIPTYETKPLKFLKEDKKNDVALFHCADSSIDFIPLALGDTETIEEGNELLFMGFPLAIEFLKMQLGVTLASTRCITSAIKRRNEDLSIDFFQIDAHTNPGVSGSPVFLVETGEVVGVVSGNFAQGTINDPNLKIPTVMGICRSINPVKDLLKGV